MNRFVLAVCLCLASPVLAGEGSAVDFNRDVRPLLSDRCFLCHGPDESTRAADLRLDTFEAAVDSGAISPGDPEWSMIIDRVLSHDPDEVMPPPETGKTVTAEEAETLKQWIREGAEYDIHWSFVPPKRPEPPAGLEGWGRNPIDQFVGGQMKRQGLKPSPAASSEKIARRTKMDLVGLPPTIEELNEVAATNDLDGFATRLLRSPHYGERWGRWWLDAARYADSDGYEKDKPRTVWFYRDWVINALNSDKPYDEFVIEQIAGDLLPDAGQDERVATGFLRNSMVNEEGGADPEQFRVEGMFDRMDAIGKSVLGVTTQCAQCHTHKYDPLSHHEYYSMFAALNDFHESMMTVYTPGQRAEADEIEARVEAVRHAVRQSTPHWREQMADWEASVRSRTPNWTVMRVTDTPFGGEKFRKLEDGSIVSESYAPTKANNLYTMNTDLRGITAVRLEALTHPQLPRGGPGRSPDGVGAVTEFEVHTWDADGEKTNTEWAAAKSDANPPAAPVVAPFLNEDPETDNRTTGPVAMAIDRNWDTAWSTDVDPARRNADHVALFFPKEPIGEDGEKQYRIGFRLQMNHGGWNSNDNQSTILGRYRFSVTSDVLDDVPVLTPEEERVLNTPVDRRTAADETLLFDRWLRDSVEHAGNAAEIDALWAAYPEGETQLVVQALKTPRTTAVMLRGDFLSPGDEVTAGVPEILGSLPQSDEPDRLRFARWLVDPQTPTPARVVVNRIWQSYFGRGLVETPEDFGMQSPLPSHPELLDWLACELIDSGWSLKHIHELIVTSETYRQSSRVTADRLNKDRYNVYLSRGPRVRAEAETVRDSVLSAAGLLNLEVGGPSVYPPAPRFLFLPPASYGTKTWDVNTDTQQFRRSLYVHRFRSALYPPLQAFDAPKADAACVRRERSNTPLQALVLLNEPQFVAAAHAMADRVMSEAADQRSRVDLAHRLVTSRTPTDDEAAVLVNLLNAERDAGRTEQAAWAAVCRVLINLDESITKG